jgi:hypothetical protein
MTFDLVRIVAFECGLSVHLAVTATGGPAELARYQTRRSTDPRDHSARWSYLAVQAGTDCLAVADAYLARPDLQACADGICTYRTDPQYWLNTGPPSESVTIAAQWPQIGLAPITTTESLAPLDQAWTCAYGVRLSRGIGSRQQPTGEG